MKVVNLGEARDLLAQWGQVKKHILKGDIKGFAICIKDDNGLEFVYLGGQYKADPQGAARVALRMSWELEQSSG